MLPPIYIDASIRNVTPVCPATDRIGFGFDFADQPPVRLALSRSAAAFLQRCLNDYINSPAGSRSPGSELMPSAPISVPPDGVNT